MLLTVLVSLKELCELPHIKNYAPDGKVPRFHYEDPKALEYMFAEVCEFRSTILNVTAACSVGRVSSCKTCTGEVDT